jgi:hemerythrin
MKWSESFATGIERIDAQALTETLDRWLADHIGLIDIQLRGCDE